MKNAPKGLVRADIGQTPLSTKLGVLDGRSILFFVGNATQVFGNKG